MGIGCLREYIKTQKSYYKKSCIMNNTFWRKENMMKILLTATLQSHIAQFHKSNIAILQSKGFTVDVAARNNLHLKKNLTLDEPDNVYEIPFHRSPFSLGNIKAYFNLKKLIYEGGYDIVHCNTPVGGILTRIACRKLRKAKKIKVIYEAHGFHFFKNGSRVNWLLWYPIEKFFARMTDVLVVINKMDFELASAKFDTKVRYIPGVGVNLQQFLCAHEEHINIRDELGINKDAFLLISVGELNANKNHATIIKALAYLKKSEIHYCIAGNGPLLNDLIKLTKELDVEKNVHFLVNIFHRHFYY